jgi:uncharacterized protein YbaP (TraB family)
LLAFCLAAPLIAQEKSSAAANLHSLWKVEGKSNTVYLLGSVHLLKAENFPLAAPLEAAYSNSAVVAFEVDPEKMEDPALQMKLMTKGLLPEGETLKTRLSAETYASFEKHAKENGVPMQLLEKMKPSLGTMILDMTQLQQLGFNPENGIDKYFAGKAKSDGKSIIGLETVEFQMDLLTGFSKEEEDLFTKESLEDMDNMKEKFGEVITAWQTGNSAALEKLLNEMLEKAPSLFKRLLTDRNQSWIPKIEEFLKGGKNAVVIVGAGHLVGPEGVVELLKKKGLKVTQL